MRKKITYITIVVILICITLYGANINDSLLVTDFSRENLPPSTTYFFGTDWLGRDLFYRTMKGISASIIIATIASLASGVIALIVGVISALSSKKIDGICCFVIDLVMSIPHLVLLILISFCCGRGETGVIIGLVCTHWTSLARVIRGEVLNIKNEQYIQMSKKFGKSNFYIAKKHIMPHIMPQFTMGIFVIFPHVILHEASITFLGFGLSPEEPAIGIILSESMNYITSGMWWLFIPAICLVAVIILFEYITNGFKET